MIKKIQPQSFLSLGLEHYLTPRVLTTCALKVAHSSGLRANENASWKLARPLGFVHSRILLYHFSFIISIGAKRSGGISWCS